MIDVSFVVTSYNYANYIGECVRSCLEQRNSPLSYEVIVVDDGSTDETEAILHEIKDSLLKKFRINNSGIELASNYGFAKSRGRFIVRVDADDKLDKTYLSVMSKSLEEESDYYYPNYKVIDGCGRVIKQILLPDFDPVEIHDRGDFLATGTMFRASVLKSVGGYATHIKNSGLENYELILKLLKKGIWGRHVHESLFYYRHHLKNISLVQQEKIVRNGKNLFARLDLGKFRTNKYHPYNLELQ